MRFFFIFGCTSAYRKPLKNKGIWVGIFQYSRVGIFPCGMCENGAYMGLYNLTERKYNFNKFTQITPSIVYIIFPHTHSLTKTTCKMGIKRVFPPQTITPKSPYHAHIIIVIIPISVLGNIYHIFTLKRGKKSHLYTIPTTH